jgi:histidinol-phosphate/aromatic aminotransferase/cobyric acid decarboxylase-like protein
MQRKTGNCEPPPHKTGSLRRERLPRCQPRTADFLRVSIGTDEEMDFFLNALF